MKEKIILWIGIAAIGLVVIIALSFLLALPTMILWNILMPVIFGLPKIGWLQAWGLMILVRMIFATSSISSGKSS